MRDEKQVTVPSRNPQPERTPDGKVGLRGCWELLIKIIILLILILILLAYWLGLGPFGPRGTYGMRGEYDLWVWFWLILLIILLIWLIWRQKHFVFLKCNLTDPVGCKSGTEIGGKWLEVIKGTATGIGFSRYELEVFYGGSLIPGAIIYADAGGNPDATLTHGNHQVTAGTLGFVDLQQALNGAGTGLYTSTDFEIRLHVIGIDHSTCNHSIHFQLNLALAAIKKVGAAWAHDYANTSEMLCRIPAPATPSPGAHAINPASVGGSIYVKGSADVHGCANEKLAEVHVWAIPDDDFSFAQPANGSVIVPPASSTYHSEVIFTNDDQRQANPLDLPGDEGAILTYDPGWFTRQVCWWVGNPPFQFCLPPVPDLHTTGWPTGPTGKYTLLLAVKDTASNTYFDIQRVWVDNDPVVAQITSIGGLTGCLDLRLSDFQDQPKNKLCEIRGFAWDRAIRAADPQAAPNDNFSGYGLAYQKNGVSGAPSITPATPGVRVPNVWDEVTPVADGVLANWDIIADIDNGASPPPAGSHKLQRGTRCAFNISLGVSDNTLVGEGGSGHSLPANYAINIINDL